MSVVVLISILVLAINTRTGEVRKTFRRLAKGKVVKMVRQMMTAGPWWASACGLGTTTLAAYGESS